MNKKNSATTVKKNKLKEKTPNEVSQKEILAKIFIENSVKDYSIFSEINILNRSIFFYGDVCDHEIERIIRYMEFFQVLDDKKDINLYINSGGGDGACCLKFYDALRSRIKVKVNTIVEGISMSAATVMSIATTGKRYITKNSTIMLHELSTYSYGKISDGKNRMKWGEDLQDIFYNIYIEHTNIKNKKQWQTLLATDTFFNAEEALKNGFVDEII